MVRRVNAPENPQAPKAGQVRRAAVALARRDFLRQGGRWALGTALTAWLVGAQTVETAHAGTPPPGRLRCDDFSASGYHCYGRLCYRYYVSNRCHARTTECNNWPGADGQCWNWDGIRYCDWWVYPDGYQRRCYCTDRL